MYGAIKILAGNFKPGTGSTYSMGKLYLRKKGQLFREKVPLANIKSLEIADPQVGASTENSLAGAVLGGALFGGAGMIAGSVIGSSNKEVALVCALRDGRQFLGMMGATDYSKLKQKVMSLTYFQNDDIRTPIAPMKTIGSRLRKGLIILVLGLIALLTLAVVLGRLQ